MSEIRTIRGPSRAGLAAFLAEGEIAVWAYADYYIVIGDSKHPDGFRVLERPTEDYDSYETEAEALDDAADWKAA